MNEVMEEEQEFGS